MQTYFSAALQKMQQDLEAAASYHIAQQAQLVDQAKIALETAAAATRATTQKAKTGAQAEAVKKATEHLAAVELRKKTLEQTFAQYRDVLRKAAV